MKRCRRGPVRAARALVAGLVVVLACSDDPPAVTHMLEQDFETRCGDGTLGCGWEQIAGPDGQARMGSGFHPADHALLLDGSGVTVRGPGGDSRTATLTLGSLRIDLGARCDPGNTLAVSVGIIDASSATPAFSDELIGTVTPARRWQDGRSGATLTARTALSEGGIGMRPPYTVRISSITLTKTGSGRCEISDLAVHDFTAFSVPTIGCSG